MKSPELELITGTPAANSTTPSARRIAVLMSGGVDSSVTALKLQQDGWEITGVNMRIPLACGGGSVVDCSGVEEVAERLNIPLYRVDLTEIFQQEVISHFECEYRQGRTPNPCCDCNRKLKFEAVWDIIESELGIENVATGHYARILREEGRTCIARGTDLNKDQSYFIYGIKPERLKHFYLPLGELSKDETRELARAAGLTVAEKSESMDLCFAGGGDYRNALSDITEDKEGDFVDTEFNVVGRHHGISQYTVGQRKLGMSFGPEPSYALRIIPEKNQVMVGTRKDAYKNRVTARLITVHQPELLNETTELQGKIRSGGELIGCSVNSYSAPEISVTFQRELFAPTPGQHLVLYNFDATIVAGGIIQ